MKGGDQMDHGLQSLLSHYVKEIEKAKRILSSFPTIDTAYRRVMEDIVNIEHRIERVLNLLEK